MKHWLEVKDYVKMICFHLLALFIIFIIHTSTLRLILFEIINIGVCSSILLLKNFAIEIKIKREAKRKIRLEEYKEQMQNENQDHFS